MEIKTIKLSEKGQIALPQAMRERAGFKPGATVVLLERDGRIFIERADRVADKLEDDFFAWDRLSDEALSNFEKSL
jgi:AbrB family looped-hinge helix DNA binding protein